MHHFPKGNTFDGNHIIFLFLMFLDILNILQNTYFTQQLLAIRLIAE